jgi:hypothetical protein
VAFHRRSWSNLDERKESVRDFLVPHADLATRRTARLFSDDPGFVKILMLKESSQCFFDTEMKLVGGGNTNENSRPLQLDKL